MVSPNIHLGFHARLLKERHTLKDSDLKPNLANEDLKNIGRLLSVTFWKTSFAFFYRHLFPVFPRLSLPQLLVLLVFFCSSPSTFHEACSLLVRLLLRSCFCSLLRPTPAFEAHGSMAKLFLRSAKLCE